MKVIVTGGNGRIGKAVVATLVESGHEVLVLDRRPADRPGAKFVYMDLRRREMLQPVMEQAEAIIHMGEIPNTRSGHNTEEEVFGTNCTIGSLVFQLAAELNYKRVIYTSTIQIYGFVDMNHAAPLKMPIDESHPANPRNPYAQAKVAIENYGRYLSETRKLSAAVFRLPWVLTHDIRDDWFDWTEREKRIDEAFGAYVKDTDVADCFEKALHKQEPGFEVYNLSAKETMFGRPIREAMLRDYPNYPQLPENWGKFDSAYVAKKAQEHFGWTPQWNYLDLFRQKMGRDPVVKD